MEVLAGRLVWGKPGSGAPETGCGVYSRVGGCHGFGGQGGSYWCSTFGPGHSLRGGGGLSRGCWSRAGKSAAETMLGIGSARSARVKREYILAVRSSGRCGRRAGLGGRLEEEGELYIVTPLDV